MKSDDPYRRPGIDVELRDYFAAQALVGLIPLASRDMKNEATEDTNLYDHAANAAYRFADAMLEARNQVDE